MSRCVGDVYTLVFRQSTRQHLTRKILTLFPDDDREVSKEGPLSSAIPSKPGFIRVTYNLPHIRTSTRTSTSFLRVSRLIKNTIDSVKIVEIQYNIRSYEHNDAAHLSCLLIQVLGYSK